MLTILTKVVIALLSVTVVTTYFLRYRRHHGKKNLVTMLVLCPMAVLILLKLPSITLGAANWIDWIMVATGILSARAIYVHRDDDSFVNHISDWRLEVTMGVLVSLAGASNLLRTVFS